MEQMAKSIEDLATMNAILQAWVPELHRIVTNPENREVRNSHIGEHREEGRNEGSRVEGPESEMTVRKKSPKIFPFLKPRPKGRCKA
jgi:hypothetical protein